VALGAQTSIDIREVSVRSSVDKSRLATALKVDATLAETNVVVRDGRGRAVPGLQRADFEIRDDGKKREIRSFVVQTAVRANGTLLAARRGGSGRRREDVIGDYAGGDSVATSGQAMGPPHC
jgi:hypothetical protein